MPTGGAELHDVATNATRVERDLDWLATWSSEDGARVDAARRAQYAAAIGCDAAEPLPLFPFVVASSSLMELFRELPVMAAAVHVAHRIDELTPLVVGEELAVTTNVTSSMPADIGSLLTLELTTLAATDLTVRNRQRADIWLRDVRMPRAGDAPGRRGETRRRVANGTAPAVDEIVLIDDSQAARYADASGDHNALHLDDVVAASVGFPRAIVHGMCTLALAVRGVTRAIPQREGVWSVSARFGRPLLRGDSLRIRAWRRDWADNARESYAFNATTAGNDNAIRFGLIEHRCTEVVSNP
jgi:acyl dehydratase